MSKATPSGKTPWRLVIRCFEVLFVVLALVFAGIALKREWAGVRDAASQLHPHWTGLLYAGAIIMGNYAMLVQSWRTLVSGFGSELPYLPAVRIYMASKLGGYIPGSFWSAAGMSIMAEQIGVQPSAAAGSALLGTLLNIGAGFGVVSLSGTRVLSALSPSLRNGSIVGAVLFVVFVLSAPWLLPGIVGWIGKRFGRGVPDRALPAKILWTSVILNTLSWFGYGWALMIFARAFYPDITGSLLQFVAVWTTAYIAGFVFFIVPAGIGVREGVFTLVMAKLGLATPGEAALLALASRLWMTILDVVPGLIGLALSPIAKGSRQRRKSART